MFNSIFRRVPKAFYRICTIKGVCGYSLIFGVGVKPLGGKMISEHYTGLKCAINTVGCIFLQNKTQIKYRKTLNLRRVARTCMFAVQVEFQSSVSREINVEITCAFGGRLCMS